MAKYSIRRPENLLITSQRVSLHKMAKGFSWTFSLPFQNRSFFPCLLFLPLPSLGLLSPLSGWTIGRCSFRRWTSSCGATAILPPRHFLTGDAMLHTISVVCTSRSTRGVRNQWKREHPQRADGRNALPPPPPPPCATPLPFHLAVIPSTPASFISFPSAVSRPSPASCFSISPPPPPLIPLHQSPPSTVPPFFFLSHCHPRQP